MYAVIKSGGKQYRVAPGDTIRVERVSGDVGEQVKFGSVLSVHTDDKKILVGDDASKASVNGKIVEQGRGKKLTVLKFKKTNQYKIQPGHLSLRRAPTAHRAILNLAARNFESRKGIASWHTKKVAALQQTAAILTANGSA